MATAYAALVSLFNTLDLIQTHPLHSFSFENNQIESLLEIVNFQINFMETGDYNGYRSEAAEALEKRIASAAHAAQDLIDSHVADQIRSGSTRSRKTRVPRFLLDLQKVIDDMEFLRRKAIKFHKAIKAKPTFPSSSSAATASSPSTSLTSQKNTMVGFDDVLPKLFDLLIGEAADRQVIPIVGMGGLGKTTLARHAFEHKLIVENFGVRLWVTISQNYDLEIILNELLSGSGKPTGGTAAELGVRLYQYLFGRRYLIILDDMWSSEVWNEIMHYFPEDIQNRSKIVVTTRQSGVAHDLNSFLCFPLDLLNKDKSWNLFCEKVFGDQKGCPPELEAVGYKIVKKCKGLPLAIVVVGGHLRNSSQTLEYWENVANDMDSILSSGEDESCMDILSLSYSYLPVHLKPCVLYVASFEEDTVVHTEFLIKLWIGEGFIKPSKTHNLEEVAEGYIKDLLDRNLILAREKKLNGKIESCIIHDIVRELCLKIAAKEKFFCVLDNPQVGHWERRVVSKSRNMSLPSTPFICSQRVLNNVDEDVFEFGCDRLNLRYLGCIVPKWRNHLHISPSISLLWSLQTLIVTSSHAFDHFVVPYEFWEMLQLRHVYINYILLPDPLPSDGDGLNQTNLQTLMGVKNFRLSEEVCKRIARIKKLSITFSWESNECDRKYLNSSSEVDATSLHNLSRLHQLESLEYCFYYTFTGFARNLTFPYSLKELSLSWSHLYWDELSNMAGSLPLLEALHLGSNAVIGSQWDTIDGHFHCLKSLTIYRCGDLANFNVDSSHFPALTNLALELLENLHELPPSIGELPSLQHIELRRCSESLAMSAMRILVEQEQEYGNDGLRLEVFFVSDEDRKSFLKRMEEEGLHSSNLAVGGFITGCPYAFQQ